jgi:Ala-tRNA(Pro) deacylase
MRMPKEKIFDHLKSLQIDVTSRKHAPVFTMEEAQQQCTGVSGGHTKNLFLRNKNKSQYYLAVLEESKKVDLKKLREKLAETKLSFGSPEVLFQKLSATPGSVSPFGLLFDSDISVIVLVDEDLLNLDSLHFHPNDNTETWEISTKDFQRFLDSSGHQIRFLSFLS